MTASVSPGQSQEMPSAERFASSARTSPGEAVQAITKQVRRCEEEGKVAGQDALTVSQQIGDAWDEKLLRNTKASPCQHILEGRPWLASTPKTTAAVLGGRDGWDRATSGSRPYGGAWEGPIFVLTHHLQDATPADGVTLLKCALAEAVQIGLVAAGGKNLDVFSPTIGHQLLELGLIDEIDLHIVPMLLGRGIRLYDHRAVSRSASTGSAKATPPRPSTCGTGPTVGATNRPEVPGK